MRQGNLARLFTYFMSTTTYIPISECKKGMLYELSSRNLISGVFNGNEEEPGFIGIREKFGSKYLFTEYHYDNGPPYGTAYPLRELATVPEGIEIRESFPTEDKITGRQVKFDRPVKDGGKGWFFIDTGESSVEIKPIGRENTPLFNWISEVPYTPKDE